MGYSPRRRGQPHGQVLLIHAHLIRDPFGAGVRSEPEGRVAGAWMMAALALGAGVMGPPFTQDLENVGEALWKGITGTDAANLTVARRLVEELA